MNAPSSIPLGRRLTLGALALLVASAIWLPLLHLFYRPDTAVLTDPRRVSPHARQLASRHLELWVDDELRGKEQARMRRSNAEWDFMGRTFLVLSFANLSLREPERKTTYLQAMDAIIFDTLAVEREKGKFHFLMSYAGNSSFVQKPPRSLFLDGEIALMLGARRVIAEHPLHKKLFVERTEMIARRLASSPVLCGESYPDECWMFCNAAALASLRMSEFLDGSDHGTLFRRWLSKVRSRLTDKTTGLLVSSFTYDGRRTIDGPEGSSIWFASHCLRLVDESFARDQYERARRELGVTLLGFS